MTTPESRAPEGQEWLVLAVAFGDHESSGAAWEKLASTLDVDVIAHDAHGVFPQLADALRRLSAEADVLPRLDGVRRRLWTRNSLRMREVAAAATALQGHHIGVEAGGGLAVLLRQPDLGRRPLVDAELVVGQETADDALAVLTGEGWAEFSRRRDGWLMDLHAVTFQRGGHEVTLRWADGPWPYSSAGSVVAPESVGSAYLRAAPPGDLLVYTLAEGFRLWGYTPTRRYADALLLLSDAQPVDWSRVLSLAAARGAEPPLWSALEAIATEMPHLVPADALAVLADRSAGRRARLAISADLRWGAAAVVLRRTHDRSALGALAATPAILRDLWDIDHPVGLPAAMARRLRVRGASLRSGQAPTQG